MMSDDARRIPLPSFLASPHVIFRGPADCVRRGKRGGVRRCGPPRRLAPSLLAGQRGERWVRRLSLADEQNLVAVRVDGLGRPARKIS